MKKSRHENLGRLPKTFWDKNKLTGCIDNICGPDVYVKFNLESCETIRPSNATATRAGIRHFDDVNKDGVRHIRVCLSATDKAFI